MQSTELEEFFVRERFTAEEKMNLAQSLLDGDAEAWFYRIQKTLIFYSWEELKDKLLLRFGDFADSDRIRLIAEQDRFLKEIRDDAKLRRLSRTAITPHESLSSPATIQDTIPVDKFSNQQVDDISGEKKDESHEATLVKVLDNLEEASVTQNQVPVSKLEPSLQISKDSPNVCENSQAVVGCEHQRSFQKNIRMDVVNGVVERSQRVMSITINVSAHQVFDKMCQLKRLKPKNKRKLHLSLKTWRFKFKNRNLQQNRSRMDHALDANIFHYISSSSRATFGYKWKQHNSKYGRRMRQTHMSRLLCNLQVRQDPKEWGQLILDDLKSHMRHKWKSKHLRAVFALQTSPSYALDVVNKTSKLWETQKTFTSTHVASVNSFSFAVGFTGDKLTELDFHLRENHRQEKKTGLLVFHWNFLPLEFFWFIHLEDKVCLSGASNSWWGWLVFDRGKNNIISGDVITLVSSKELWMEILEGDITKLLNSTCGKLQSYDYGLEITFLRRLRVHQQQQKRKFIKSWRFKYKSSLRNTRSESREMNQFVGFLKFQLKHKWRSKHLHTISALGFYLSSVFSTVTPANFGWLQGLLEQVLQRDDEAYTKILDKLQLNLKQGMDVHGASGLRLFLRQQKFSSIWHRWRRKDWDLEVQLRERDLMLSQVQHISQRAQAIMERNTVKKRRAVIGDHHQVQASVLAFKLEDKLVFQGESIDTIQ